MTDADTLPDVVRELASELGSSPGVVAVVLGGSQATGEAKPGSDWDLGLYYRAPVDLAPLAAHGEVHPPGAWGRIMNGGCWLDLDGVRVDVLLRDLDAVDHWTAVARRGEFEIDGLLGYLAGIPTYSLTAEASIARVLSGHLDVDVTFPAALAERAPARWRFCRDFSLDYAAKHAVRGNAALAAGQAARAALEEAHARCCAERRWVLNEKHLLRAAGLADVEGWVAHDAAAIDALRARLAD